MLNTNIATPVYTRSASHSSLPVTKLPAAATIQNPAITVLPSQPVIVEYSETQKLRFASICSYVMQGIDSIPIRVEVSIVPGLPKLEIIGLPDTAIKESKERILKSLIAHHYKVPTGNITVNLSSANLRKRGTLYDLPITLGLLIASKQIPKPANLQQFIIAGELSLEGTLRRAEGLFSTALENLEHYQKLYYLVPRENEADFETLSKVRKLQFFCVANLAEAIQTLHEQKTLPRTQTTAPRVSVNSNYNIISGAHTQAQQQAQQKDFNEVAGHSMAKLALQLAAINRLNVLFVGPPGAGKSMLMHRMPSILPPLDFQTFLMANRIYKAYDDSNETMLTQQPLRVVHSSIHSTSLIGGGRVPRPGEISLAHGGFLFLDELSEFERNTLQNLRTPLDLKYVTISRVEQQVTFPCNFTLLACTNPCNCGYYGDMIKSCTCTRTGISRFYSKLSGPLLDRFDMMVYISKLAEKDFTEEQALSSATMKTNVANALQRKSRYQALHTNKTLKELFTTHSLARELIGKAIKKEIVSLRKVTAIFKIIHALELFYDRKIDKTIVLQALELARTKLEI